jgi:uncharacterized protein YyaL (SSP411 family)
MVEPSGRGEKQTRKAWDEVGKEFSDVGRRIGEHYRKLGEETRSAAAAQRQTVTEAVRKAVDQLDQAFTGLGNALRDPETKKTLNRATRSLGQALDTTLGAVGEKIRKRSDRKDSSGDPSKDNPGADASH